jgi:hypothetical protein
VSQFPACLITWGGKGEEPSRLPYFFSTYSFAETIVISFVTSGVTTSRSAGTSSFLSSTMAAEPEEAEWQTRI